MAETEVYKLIWEGDSTSLVDYNFSSYANKDCLHMQECFPAMVLGGVKKSIRVVYLDTIDDIVNNDIVKNDMEDLGYPRLHAALQCCIDASGFFQQLSREEIIHRIQTLYKSPTEHASPSESDTDQDSESHQPKRCCVPLFSQTECGCLADRILDLQKRCMSVRDSFQNDLVKHFLSALFRFAMFGMDTLDVLHSTSNNRNQLLHFNICATHNQDSTVANLSGVADIGVSQQFSAHGSNHVFLLGEGKTKKDVDLQKTGEGQLLLAMIACFLKANGATTAGIILSPHQICAMELTQQENEVLVRVAKKEDPDSLIGANMASLTPVVKMIHKCCHIAMS